MTSRPLTRSNTTSGALRKQTEESRSRSVGYWEVEASSKPTPAPRSHRYPPPPHQRSSTARELALVIEERCKASASSGDDSNSSSSGDCDLSSTQRLRKGFFRAIKRQYPSVQRRGEEVASNTAVDGEVGKRLSSAEKRVVDDDDTAVPSITIAKMPAVAIGRDNATTSNEIGGGGGESFIMMKRSARRRLNQLRKCDPKQIDIETGLQWIRLELNELREQDKSIYLQLSKVYANIKDLKSELNQKSKGEDFEYSCEDFYQLPSWWYSHGTIDEAAEVTSPFLSPVINSSSVTSGAKPRAAAADFSASDSAQFVRALSVQSRRRRRGGRSPLPVPLPPTSPAFNF